MEVPYPILNVYSGFTFYSGVNSPEELCQAAHERGYSSMLLADVNGLYSALNFQEIALSKGLKPLHGAELKKGGESALIIVENSHGWKNLCRCITEIKMGSEKSLADLLSDNLEGCILVSDSPPVLQKCIVEWGEERVYVRVRPFSSRKKLKELLSRFKLKPLATSDVRFVDPEDYSVLRVLSAIKHKTSIEDAPFSEEISHLSYMRGREEAFLPFSDVPESVENARVVEERCEFLIPKNPVIPSYPGTSHPQSLLEKLVWDGAVKRYRRITEPLRRRIKKELTIIREKNFADYFLIAWDIGKTFPLHCGRGSVANSVVSYCLFITDVDPLKHNLAFERFLNPSRTEAPDIDIDFPWDEREEVKKFIERKYGEERVAFVANHVTFGERGAFREVGRVFGFTESDISRAEHLLHHFPEKVLKNREWKNVFSLSRRIKDLPTHLSAHCGGVIITANPMWHYIPVEKTSSGIKVVQWEKDQCEERGLLKLDILGNRTLAVIRDTLNLVKKTKGVTLDYHSIDGEDPEVKDMFAQGKTLGVFYVESPASRLLSQKTKRGEFPILVINTSIIRPAANRFIREYVERLLGKPYEVEPPVLRKILPETFGIVVYQEDVIDVVREVAGFSWDTADKLRKSLSKKRGGDRLQHFRDLFFKGGISRGYAKKDLEKLWDMILSFSGYSFCKGHSASYIDVAVKSCFLKRYYPAEFMASVINNRGGYYDTYAYVSEARRSGIKVLPPDINKSEREFTVEGENIRVGLGFLKGLKKESIETILAEREKGGKFPSFRDFMMRCSIPPSDVHILIKAGCFRNIDPSPEPSMIIQALSGKCLTQGNFLKPFSKTQRILNEYEIMGFTVSGSLFELFESSLKHIPRDISSRLNELPAGSSLYFAGVLITSKPALTKQNLPMEFVTFEDEKGLVECVLFPENYKKYAHLLKGRGPYAIRGKLMKEFRVPCVEITELKKLTGKTHTAHIRSTEASAGF